MIHYHGGPVSPIRAAATLWRGKHAFVSFAHPQQLPLAAEVAQSFALDNGAFSFWRAGKGRIDVPAYAAWVEQWRRHPGFDWALIPDVIDGTEEENDRMFAVYREAGGDLLGSVPVWHLHESLERLQRLCRTFARVALGSSGEYSQPGSKAWWVRMAQAMDAVCDVAGRPPCKLHGLRMLDGDIFSRLPLSSADSTNAAINIAFDGAWKGTYQPITKAMRAAVLVDRIEARNSAAVWLR